MSAIIGILKNQERKGKKPLFIKPNSKVGFAFSTKDRVELSLKSLPTIDQDGGFDIIWVDGSITEAGKNLPKQYKFKKSRLVEAHSGVGGGPDKAIQYGLKRLIDLGYDYCGLIENDILFNSGWFDKLMNIFNLSARDGIAVGSASVRTFESRVLEYRDGYTINWNAGAGMILFTREAAQLILNNYSKLKTVGSNLCYFYGKLSGVDLRAGIEPCHRCIGYYMSADFGYEKVLYNNGLASIGTIPSLVDDIGIDLGKKGLVHVKIDKNKIGDNGKKTSFLSLILLKINSVMLIISWWILRVLGKSPFLKKIGQDLEKLVRSIMGATPNN